MNDDVVLVVQQVFRQVRPMILERAGKVSFETKADGSPVTATDAEVESIIFKEFAARFPDLPVFGEETGYDEDNLPEICWLIDPIDGTKSFIADVPAYTNMAVLIERGEAAACVIYNPSTDEMYVARKGQGAFKNDVLLDLSAVPLANVAYCKGRFIEPLEAIISSQGVRCKKGPQGAGYGFSMVAAGKAAARFNMLAGGYVHDYAPGALLVREAGGAILPFQSADYSYKTRSFVACHPALAKVLEPHLARLAKLEIDLADA